MSFTLDVYGIIPPGGGITYLGTLDDAFDIGIRPVRNQIGSGQFTISRHSPNVGTDILKAGNLVKVTVPEIDDEPIFAFLMETGLNELVSSDEEGGENVTIGGAGSLSYLGWAMWLGKKYAVDWWPADMSTPPADAEGALRVSAGRYRFYHLTGSPLEIDPDDPYSLDTVAEFDAYYQDKGVYRWEFENGKGEGFRFLVRFMAGQPHPLAWMGPYGQDQVQEIQPGYAKDGQPIELATVIPGNLPGAVLERMVAEAQAADRPQHPLALLTIDFDDTEDSDGNPWSSSDALAALTAERGESYLTTLSKLVSTGVLDVEMTPDLVLHAWNQHGRDLTSDTFAEDKVRFVKGVNIADELDRAFIDGPIPTFTEVLGTVHGGFKRVQTERADSADLVAREISVSADSQNATALEAAGQAVLTNRGNRGEHVTFRVTTGGNAEEGYYRPGPEGTANGNYWLGDMVRLHTGSGAADFDEADLFVHAITIEEDDGGGNMQVTVELALVRNDADAADFASASSGIDASTTDIGCGCPCDPGQEVPGSDPPAFYAEVYGPSPAGTSDGGGTQEFPFMDISGTVPLTYVQGTMLVFVDGVLFPIDQSVSPVTGITVAGEVMLFARLACPPTGGGGDT